MAKPPVELELVWEGDLRFKGTAGTQSLALDGDGASAPSPVQALAFALAGCMAADLVHILRKGRYEVGSVRARFHGERAESEPRRFVRIDLRFVVGGDAPDDRIERALALSAKRTARSGTRYAPTSRSRCPSSGPPPPLDRDAAAATLARSSPPVMSSEAPGARWFYIQGGRRQGPVELPRLVEILLALEAPDEALVWQPGMPEWVKAGSLEAIRRELPPPVPRPHAADDPPEPVASEGAPAGVSPSAPEAAADGAAANIVLPAAENAGDEESGRLRRRRHRHHDKKGVISRDFRPYVLPLVVLLLTMIVALWWLLRRVNEVPPGRILIQGALAGPAATGPDA